MHAHEIGAAVYEAAGLSPHDPVPGGAPAIAELFRLGIFERARAKDEASLARWGGRTRIVLREGLQPQRANFLVARELVRHFVRLEEIEADAARISRAAAWVVAPQEIFEARYHQVGFNIAALAQPFAITLTAAALRLNEVVGIELAVVGRAAIHRRSSRLLGHLSDADLRCLAAKRSPRSVRRVPLRDDGAAIALIAG